MTQEEWTKAIASEFRGAGFIVTEHEGFPLIKTPESFEDKKRFFDFKCSRSIVQRIYAEGVLILPA